MKSRLFLNLALLVIVVVLGALAILEPGKEEAENQALAPVDEAALDKITLQNKETIVFEKKDGHWRLTAPIQAPANEIRVRQLIDIARSNSEAAYPLKPEELQKFELDKPKASLILGGTTLVFGGSDPIDMRRYVRVGETLHLVNDNFFHHLQAAATDYVDKKLLPENAKVREIVVPGLKATLGPDGKWTQEAAAPNNRSDLPELATLWATARAIDVRRLEPPAQGDPVRIGLAEGNPVEFVIIRREPDPVLARPELGLQYELTGETARQLLNLPKPAPAAGQPAADGKDANGDEESDPGYPDMDEEGAAGEDDGGAEGHDHGQGQGEADEEPMDSSGEE
ncbi:protein of unknown function [Methylomagnum ishizawai]|uniref:DUF4340 domain-containing protein n=1 Tax=Methylomagnum ishizawai TaxID=1760988 RepID=A0A1Y6DB61_9GAMM|nr:DUF4340 domain-containing protein [Methylomagnum ishizawai]SMF96875.1 protein of unknown function [Methylomagnum ishizawai]